MNSELEKTLCGLYPRLLCSDAVSNVDLFYFECGDGWFDIIYTALGVMFKHSRSCSCGITITQIKEELGLLRIYCNGGDEYTSAAIKFAELMSELVCEICGDHGVLSSTMGWSQVRCDIHKEVLVESLTVLSQTSDEYRSDLAKTVELALGFFGPNPRWALVWFNEPLAALGYTKPYELLRTCEGCSAVRTIIERLEHGVFT